MRRLHVVDKFAILGLSMSLALIGCSSEGPDQPNTSMPTSNFSVASGLVTSAPLETATSSQTLPVYWLGTSNDDIFLYREFVPAQSSDDPIVAALRVIMGGKAEDPDYFSVWNHPSRLGASISAKNVITIDVSADAFSSKVDAGIAERSISQVVYTATAAAAMAGLVDTTTPIQVSILVDGHTGYDAFGQLPLEKPLTRMGEFIAPVWIIDPANGSHFNTLPLKVAGQAISPTGSLAWSLSRVEAGTVGERYLSGTVKVEQGPHELGDFSFTLVPPPGQYELSVYVEDPAAPGKKLGLDTKIVSISEPSAK